MKKFVDEMRKEYSLTWENDSEYFNLNGYYCWMEKAVSSYRTILEVGCGNGYSTLTLLQNNHKVIVVDYNPYCLEKTKQLLEDNGFSAKLIRREEIVDIHGIVFESVYKEIVDDYDESFVWLIEADILKDEYLENWLLRHKKVDAIVGWLVGGNKSMARRKHYLDLGIRSDADYRMEIEDSIYRLGNIILSQGNAINYVSRSLYPSEDDLKRYIEGVQQIDIESAYECDIVDIIEYNHKIPGGISMHANHPELVDSDRRVLLSTILIKK